MKTSILKIWTNFPEEIELKIDTLIKESMYAPIWQKISWNKMLQDTFYAGNWYMVYVEKNDEVIGFCVIEKRSIWLGMNWLFVIWWPIIKDYSALAAIEEALAEKAINENDVFCQIESIDKFDFKLFKNWSYKNFLEKCTAIIDLKKSEEEILAWMKQKWRYNIKVAEKNWVTINHEKLTEDSLDIFYSMLTETKDRDWFNVNSKEYFKKFIHFLESEWLGWLYFAKIWWETAAWWIFSFYWKTALYYYGASSSDINKRRCMPTYLLQWELIKEAKKRWCEIFDFLGIACPGDKKSHLLWVTDFKLKLTWDIMKLPETKIFVYRPLVYLILKTIKAIKKFRIK